MIRLTSTSHTVYVGMISEDTFLSSSAEYLKAASAPRCAKLSLKRAMSDNSNSTGSSGSSTNSWTLLSPEVGQRKLLRKLCYDITMPGYYLEQRYYPVLWIQVNVKYEVSRQPRATHYDKIMVNVCTLVWMNIYKMCFCVRHWVVYSRCRRVYDFWLC